MNENFEINNTSNEDILASINPNGESIVDQFNNLIDASDGDKKKSIESLSDDELNKLLKNLTLYDEQERNFVFPSEDEAIIFASALQENDPKIRFCEINKCFSIRGGIFYTITPMTTVKAEQMSNQELLTTEDIIVPNEIIFMMIIERAKRKKAKQNEVDGQNN